ncbi:phage baseplate plug family protein, partial [Hymenobacter terricola]
MIEIPLTPYPDQELQIDLGGQACTIRVFERAGFMYMDLSVRRTKILKGAL